MLVLHLDHVYVCVRISRGAEDVLFVECRVLQIVHPIVGIGLPTEPSKNVQNMNISVCLAVNLTSNKLFATKFYEYYEKCNYQIETIVMFFQSF